MKGVFFAFLLLGVSVAGSGQTFTMGAGKSIGEDSRPKQLFSEPVVPSSKPGFSQGTLNIGQSEPAPTYSPPSSPPEASASPGIAIATAVVAVVAMGTGAWTIRRRALR